MYIRLKPSTGFDSDTVENVLYTRSHEHTECVGCLELYGASDQLLAIFNLAVDDDLYAQRGACEIRGIHLE
jgi:hypothetical protein